MKSSNKKNPKKDLIFLPNILCNELLTTWFHEFPILNFHEYFSQLEQNLFVPSNELGWLTKIKIGNSAHRLEVLEWVD